MALLRFSQLRRTHFALAIAVACLAFATLQLQAQARTAAQRRPVLVELFTSEGCSDCPPADELLGKLDTLQFVPGAEAIVLSEHVTYWNHQGWRDPFSFDQMTERQAKYAQHFNLKDVYTPQIVVDGAEQLVGNDPAKLGSAVARAAAMPKLDLTIEEVHPAANGAIIFSVHAAPGAQATLVAAIAENATSSHVARGENAGRTLHHVAVVRVLKDFGAAGDHRTLELAGANLTAAEKAGAPLRLIVFLVNRKNGQVVGVAEQALNLPQSGAVEQTAK
jgi:hypothetical protein